MKTTSLCAAMLIGGASVLGLACNRTPPHADDFEGQSLDDHNRRNQERVGDQQAAGWNDDMKDDKDDKGVTGGSAAERDESASRTNDDTSARLGVDAGASSASDNVAPSIRGTTRSGSLAGDDNQRANTGRSGAADTTSE